MKLTFKTLSPLHIGGAETLTPMDFIVVDKKCYIISEPKLSQLLAEKGLIDDFIASFSQRSRSFDLRRYLEKYNLATVEPLNRLCRYQIHCAAEPPSQTLRPFIRNAFSRPFIPGSAIKGSLRTAILYCIIKHLPPELKETYFIEPIKKNLQEAKESEQHRSGQPSATGKKPRKKNTIKENCFSDERFFQNYLLRKTGKRDPKYDLFRCLIVRDSAPLDRDALVDYPIKIYTYRQQPKPFPIHAECLPPGQSFTCEIIFAEHLWQQFIAENPTTHWQQPMRDFRPWLEDPLTCSKIFCKDLLASERDFYEEAFATTEPLPPRADLRLGWGGGLLSASVALLLPKELRQKLRDLLFTSRGGAPAPKTRKFIDKAKQPFFSLGWLVITDSDQHHAR